MHVYARYAVRFCSPKSLQRIGHTRHDVGAQVCADEAGELRRECTSCPPRWTSIVYTSVSSNLRPGRLFVPKLGENPRARLPGLFGLNKGRLDKFDASWGCTGD